MRIKTQYSLTTKAPSLHNGGEFSQRVTVKSVIFQIQMREAFFPIALKKNYLGWKVKTKMITTMRREHSVHEPQTPNLITSALNTGILLSGKQTENRPENWGYNQPRWKSKLLRRIIMTTAKSSGEYYGGTLYHSAHTFATSCTSIDRLSF